MRMKKCVGVLLASMLALGGCAGETAKDVVIEVQDSIWEKPQTVEVVRGNLCKNSYYDAQIGPRVEQLTFEEEGRFGELHVQLGDEVKEGDILASPAKEDVESAIENKQEEIENLKRTYNYQKTTIENNIAIAKLELENVYEQLETLEYLTPAYTQACMQAGNYAEQQKKLELQLTQLTETYELQLPYQEKQLAKLIEKRDGNIIRAPFDGTVIALEEAEYGNPIDTGKYYVALADTTKAYARCESISITVLNRVKRIIFWLDGKEHEAAYIPMDHDYYLATQNSGETVYSEFEVSNPLGEVQMGDAGKIKLIYEEKENVLMIPENALQSAGGIYYAYKDVNGSHERVEVEIGISDGMNVEIVKGLEEGDVVYVQE